MSAQRAFPRQHRPHRHRVECTDAAQLIAGRVRFSLPKTVWLGAMIGGAVLGMVFYPTARAIAVYGVTTALVLLLGHSLGSHRKLIHQSFGCPRWLEYFLAYMGVQAGLAGPFGLLRQHELRDYAQRLPHCHDYLRHGRGMLNDAWWQLCCDLELERPPHIEIESRLAGNRYFRVLEATWRWQQVPIALLFYAAGGWSFVLWGSCARVATCVIGHWLIGYFAHNHGHMRHRVRGAAVQGRNVRFVSLLTMGESWHNNHHAFPGSARLGLYAGEWDPGWWVLALLERAGLVWQCRLPRDLPTRPELERVDDSDGGREPRTQNQTNGVSA